jgi:hypothetical protein
MSVGSQLITDRKTPSLARKSLDRPDIALISGRIVVDAPSTKEVWLEATWTDIVDSTSLKNAYSLQPGNASTDRHNVIFRQFEPPRPSSRALLNLIKDTFSKTIFTEQFSLQCSESHVFLGEEHTTSKVTKIDELRLPDCRRRVIDIVATAACRFGNEVADLERLPATSSHPRSFDVPSAVYMTPPQVAYVVPLKREYKDFKGRGNRADFALRVYLRGPMFLSGPGERIAIACAADLSHTIGAAFETPKHVSQWGEDPIERAKLIQTKRLPRASDFVLNQSSSKVESHFDPKLYPSNIVGGSAAVIYRDGVRLPQKNSDSTYVSLAAYAVRFNPRKKLWFFDVSIAGEFFGWCGLALYRYQPHAVEGLELSTTANWIYASLLYEEPVAWVDQRNQRQITVGPVYDKTVSFELDMLQYLDGVSLNLESAPNTRVALKERRVGNARYFHGVALADSPDLSLVRIKFGHAIQSRPLNNT